MLRLPTGRARPDPAAAAELSDADLPPLDPTIPPWPGRCVTVDGTQLFVRHTPGARRGERALYVHGLGGASTNWTDLAAQLAPWLDGDALDLPGFGWSGPAPRGDYSMAAHERTVITYLERYGPAPVHLLGNSLGGAVCIGVADRRPDLVRTLTLLSPAVPDLRPDRLRNHPLLPLVAVPGAGHLLMRQLDRMAPEQRVRGVIDMCFGDPSGIPPHRLAEAADDIRARRGQYWAGAAFIRSLRSLLASYLVPGSHSMWARMARIQAPTLVVWGDRDRLVDVALAPRVARTIPGARLLVLAGAGHVAQMERPVETARAVLALIGGPRAG